jgi:hypothetical protein
MKKVEEKKILIQIVGILVSLLSEAITINESEKCLFTPYIVNNLIDRGCERRIINIIEECCELEDIKSLIPHKMNDNIERLRDKSLSLLKEYETIDDIYWD